MNNYLFPWDTNYIRIRLISGKSKTPWSNIIKEYAGPSLVPTNIDKYPAFEYIYNLNLANLFACNYDTSIHYYLYQDSTPSFNSPTARLLHSNSPGFGNVKLIGFAMNYFKARYVFPKLGIDSTYPVIYKTNGPTGKIPYSQPSSRLAQYRFKFPSGISKFEMEFDTTKEFNSTKKFSQQVNAAGISDYDAIFSPVSKYIRYYMRYRVHTDSLIYPWILCKESRILTPEIQLLFIGDDTTIILTPSINVKDLDSAQYYFFEMDSTPAFNSLFKTTKKYSVSQLSTYWLIDTMDFKQNLFFRAYIKSASSATDWSPTLMYTPKRKVYNFISGPLNYPYFVSPKAIPIGASHIRFQVFKDTAADPISSLLLCLDFSVSSCRLNPNMANPGEVYVRLRYEHRNSVSDWSQFKSLLLGSSVNYSSMPNPYSPIDCSRGNAGMVTLRWHKNPDCDLYQVYYTHDLNWVGAKRYLWTTDTFATVNLLPFRNYYWQVYGLDSSLKLSYSAKTFNYYTNGIQLSNDEDINSTGTDALNIYPNPAKDIVILDCSTPITSIKLLSAEGMQVPVIWNIQYNTLNVQQLPLGIYIIEVTTNSGKLIKKFIKI